jgi:hypothetical protein
VASVQATQWPEVGVPVIRAASLELIVTLVAAVMVVKAPASGVVPPITMLLIVPALAGPMVIAFRR